MQIAIKDSHSWPTLPLALLPNRIMRRFRRRREPTGHRRLLPRVEVDTFSSLDVQVAEE